LSCDVVLLLLYVLPLPNLWTVTTDELQLENLCLAFLERLTAAILPALRSAAALRAVDLAWTNITLADIIELAAVRSDLEVKGGRS
jgi:hypothetical protein